MLSRMLAEDFDEEEWHGTLRNGGDPEVTVAMAICPLALSVTMC